MRLTELVPSISAFLVDLLEVINIRTEADLLFSISTFDIIKRLPENSVTIAELEAAKELVIELCSSSGENACRMTEHAAQTKPRERLSIGYEPLDQVLHGLPGGTVVQVSGDKESGKTLTCLNIVLRQLGIDENLNALWIDTTGSFLVDTAMLILDFKQLNPTILNRLQVSISFDIETAQSILDDLDQTCPGLIVIDTITPLFAPLLSAVSAQGHAIMSEFMGQLRSLSQTKHATILVVNNTARQGPETLERKPALGPSFGLLTDSTLWLQKTGPDTSSPFSARLISSKSMASGQSTTFGLESLSIVAP